MVTAEALRDKANYIPKKPEGDDFSGEIMMIMFALAQLLEEKTMSFNIIFEDEEKEVSKTTKIISTAFAIPVVVFVLLLVLMILAIVSLYLITPFIVFLYGIETGSIPMMVTAFFLALFLWR